MTPIIISYQKGAYTVPQSTDDHVSALVFLGQVIPSSFSVNPKGFSEVKKFLNMTQVEAAGITLSYVFTAKIWYHCARFFRNAPGATLYVMVSTTPDDNTYLKYLQSQVEGIIKQVGVSSVQPYNDVAMLSEMSDLATSLLDLRLLGTPMAMLYECDMNGYTGAALDAAQLNYPDVCLLASQDGSALGAELSIALGQSVGCVGTALGCTASGQVHQSIGWVERFNINENGIENAKPAIANGTLNVDNPDLVDEYISARHVVMVKYTPTTGTHFRIDCTCTDRSVSDIHSLARLRVYNKISRVVTTTLIPKINAPLQKNTSGNLSDSTVAWLEELVQDSIDTNLLKRGEISASSVTIDPVLGYDPNTQTSMVSVQIEVIDVGSAESFNVSLTYATSI